MQQILLRENKIGRSKEHFWVICLANNNSILNIELVSLGPVKEVIINPMEVFSFALQKRTVRIILVIHEKSAGLTVSEETILKLHKLTKGEIWGAGYRNKQRPHQLHRLARLDASLQRNP